MIPISLKEICDCLSASPISCDAVISDITTDSRKITEGCLFVALPGERFDGHDFALKAIEEGAAASVVCRDFPGVSEKLIRVPDTLIALGKIAGAVRNKLSVPVAGVTGSVGKTTSKEMISLALSPLGNVCKTKLNYNNEIGLPMTIFSATETDKALVGEMGMRGLGEIKYLAEILRPDIGIITNIGVSHIERLGSRENIMKAKTEICYGLSENSVLLCGAEDYNREDIKARVDSFGKNIKLKFFGLREDSDYYASNIETDELGIPSFTLMPLGKKIKLSVFGHHNVRNAVGALALANELGIDMDAAITAVSSFAGDKVRQNIVKLDGGRITLIDDTYNAGPESMAASLRVLENIKADKKLAYLGSMLELGSASYDAHKTVYETADEICTEFFTVGKEWSNKGDFADSEEAAKHAAVKCEEGSVAILVKGSHAMEMNKITELLKNKFGAEKDGN